MGEAWKPEHGQIVVDDEGYFVHVPAGEFEAYTIDMTCPGCGADILNSEDGCTCWTWDYSEGFDDD